MRAGIMYIALSIRLTMPSNSKSSMETDSTSHRAI